MPPSKQARTRQNRQKDRVALAHAQQRRVKRRRRQAGTVAAILTIVILLVLAFTVGTPGDDKVIASSPTTPTVTEPSTTTTTIKPLASVKGKPCVKLADKLPAGAPNVDVAVGPPPTKLITKDLKIGTGAVVKATDTITANYIGVACSNGKIFDSSYTRGQPATFPLANVIKGWTDGIPGMKVGGQRLLGIPSDQAYGSKGGGSDIAPDEALWFVVDITKIGE